MSWRDHLKIHPAADLFPPMSESELRELGEDIKANGLRAPIVLYKGKLLDGRNRPDAMQLVGIKVTLSYQDIRDDYLLFLGSAAQRISHTAKLRCNTYRKGNPYDYVRSANLHRRHLTSEQKRELIAKELKAKPEASNRQIAKQVKADDKTVAKVRSELESGAEIPHLEKMVGADGKQYKSRPKKTPEPVKHHTTESAEVSIEQRRAENARLARDPESEIAEPGVIEDNVLWTLQRVNEHARLFKKLFKASTFDREAKERINTAFDKTIQKLRSTQAALGLVPDSTGAGGRPR